MFVSQIAQMRMRAKSCIIETKSVVKCIMSLSCNAGCSIGNNSTTPCLIYKLLDAYSLVALKLADALLHLLIRVDAEAVLGDAGQLYVLGIELLLHDLLESAESEGLGFLEGQAPAVDVSIFARGLRSSLQRTCGTR